MKFNTGLIHGGKQREAGHHATAMPVYQNNSFYQESSEDLEAVFRSEMDGYAYTRMGNPTITEFENRMANAEGGIGAASFASGMAAITMSVLNILEAGDELISSPSLFSGTIGLFSELKAFGIKTRYVENMVPEEVEALITDKTKAVFAELIGNPKLDVVDVAALKEVTSKHGIPLIIDSTTTTPYLLKPAELGADIIVHSSSKYIGGSGNVISGTVIDSGNFDWTKFQNKALEVFKRFGREAYMIKLKKGISQKFGPCMAPFNAYMNTVGLETLGVRMERLCQNAYTLAKALEESGKLDCVHYPGLKSSPWYETAKKQFGKEQVGAILTFRAGTKERAYRILNNLNYAYIATNIGDVRTLVIHPASTIYVSSTGNEKLQAGVYDDLVRVSVGLEDPEDMIADFLQAIDKADQ